MVVRSHRDECVCCFFRHWEAIKKWDEAIQLTPDDSPLYEMKSQVYIYQLTGFSVMSLLLHSWGFCHVPLISFYVFILVYMSEVDNEEYNWEVKPKLLLFIFSFFLSIESLKNVACICIQLPWVNAALDQLYLWLKLQVSAHQTLEYASI